VADKVTRALNSEHHESEVKLMWSYGLVQVKEEEEDAELSDEFNRRQRKPKKGRPAKEKKPPLQRISEIPVAAQESNAVDSAQEVPTAERGQQAVHLNADKQDRQRCPLAKGMKIKQPNACFKANPRYSLALKMLHPNKSPNIAY
jgi:hypothetical protein